MSTFQHLSSPGTKATHLALQQAWLRVLSGRKPLKHCKVNFWHPGYCVCPKPLTRTAFLLNCKTQKKNSEGLEQNWHLHSHMFIFYTCFPCHSSIECWYQIPNFTSSNQKRQETSHVMSETKCWASVPLPTMVDPTENVVLVSWTWGGSTVSRKSFKMTGKVLGQRLDKACVTFGCPVYTPSLLLLTSKLWLWNTTIIRLESDMLQAQSPRLSGWPCSFADCSMLQQRPQPQTTLKQTVTRSPLAIPGNGNKSKT